MKRAILVYQGGIANVFEIRGRARIRKLIMQHAFGPCEWFCRGLVKAGWNVTSMHCNMAGDISYRPWDANLDNAPFRESMKPVFTRAPRDTGRSE